MQLVGSIPIPRSCYAIEFVVLPRFLRCRLASSSRLMTVKSAKFFSVDECDAGRRSSGKRYSEFLRVPAMSAGLYVLPAGGADIQSPHQQDEVYYVVRGQARMRSGSEDQAVSEGSIVFVGAHVEHRFYEITEELMLLVMFAPAETE